MNDAGQGCQCPQIRSGEMIATKGPLYMSIPASFESAPTASSMPDWYPDLLASVAIQINTGRFRAVATANQELVRSYWSIGHELLARESKEGWGSKVVTRLSTDLRDQFPEARGFSPRNLRYMKTFAAAWPDTTMLQTASATLPWSHHVLLLEKLNTPEERLWYMACAIDEGWSHSVLGHQIETQLRERAGKAITNFKATLPPSDSDLTQQS
ncbi:MAG: DUF1016 N-terminal domain-containing protein, partial [Actinomycetota bacterium]|nr:DUF1016 N-terminal domain-containing protein [Actinomycetota bacterium]